MFKVQKIVKGHWVNQECGTFATMAEAGDMARHLQEAGFKTRIVFAAVSK